MRQWMTTDLGPLLLCDVVFVVFTLNSTLPEDYFHLFSLSKSRFNSISAICKITAIGYLNHVPTCHNRMTGSGKNGRSLQVAYLSSI